MPELYIGIMSGTSLDGIDVSLIDLTDDHIHVIDSLCLKFPSHLLAQLVHFIEHKAAGFESLATATIALSEAYANAVQIILDNNNLKPSSIVAIGCHGQTVYHYPTHRGGYSMQLVSGAHLAELCKMTVVCDFRNNDMALGGQGAPLVPAFHRALVKKPANQLIVNLGGIANLTWIEETGHLEGFDTGPANCLLDLWFQKHHQNEKFDNNGRWAASGQVNQALLKQFLADPYFKLPPPKSTGKEYFNLNWLDQQIAQAEIIDFKPEDIQATLLELTAQSIVTASKPYPVRTFYVCGGGIHNQALLKAIENHSGQTVVSTRTLGVEADEMEAVAFAWLAKQRLEGLTNTVATVTGSNQDTTSGAIYLPSPLH